MTIKEAEKATGVSKRNIRFYEQKGLLAPVRNRENDYREYSDADIERLKLIRALRMVDMPLEQILEVTQGKKPIRTAIEEQKEILQQRMKKLETAIHFCDELAQELDGSVSEVLTRMDEPENCNQLSKKWYTDYAQTLKNILTPVSASLYPFLFGQVFGHAIFLAMWIGGPFPYLLALIFPASWVFLGYYLYRRGKWWRSLALCHAIPAAVYGVLLWQERFHTWGERSFLWNITDWFDLPLTVLDMVLFDSPAMGSVTKFLLLVVCFCLGGLIARVASKLAPEWRARKKKTANHEKRQYTIPPQLIALFAVIVIPIIAAMLWVIFAPLPNYLTTEVLGERISTNGALTVEKGAFSYHLAGSEELAEQFCFEQWERAYFAYPSDRPVLEVHMSSDRTEPYAIEFYSNGVVRVYEAWIATKEGYYKVPEELAEQILEYAKEYGIRE